MPLLQPVGVSYKPQETTCPQNPVFKNPHPNEDVFEVNRSLDKRLMQKMAVSIEQAPIDWEGIKQLLLQGASPRLLFPRGSPSKQMVYHASLADVALLQDQPDVLKILFQKGFVLEVTFASWVIQRAFPYQDWDPILRPDQKDQLIQSSFSSQQARARAYRELLPWMFRNSKILMNYSFTRAHQDYPGMTIAEVLALTGEIDAFQVLLQQGPVIRPNHIISEGKTFIKALLQQPNEPILNGLFDFIEKERGIGYRVQVAEYSLRAGLLQTIKIILKRLNVSQKQALALQQKVLTSFETKVLENLQKDLQSWVDAGRPIRSFTDLWSRVSDIIDIYDLSHFQDSFDARHLLTPVFPMEAFQKLAKAAYPEYLGILDEAPQDYREPLQRFKDRLNNLQIDNWCALQDSNL